MKKIKEYMTQKIEVPQWGILFIDVVLFVNALLNFLIWLRQR